MFFFRFQFCFFGHFEESPNRMCRLSVRVERFIVFVSTFSFLLGVNLLVSFCPFLVLVGTVTAPTLSATKTHDRLSRSEAILPTCFYGSLSTV